MIGEWESARPVACSRTIAGMSRPSPALVVASLALVVALGGTSYAAAKLAANSVGARELKANAVTSAKIAPGGVRGADIAAAAVSGAKLADGAVAFGKIADGAVGPAKLADGAVGPLALADGSVGASKLAPDALGSSRVVYPWSCSPFTAINGPAQMIWSVDGLYASGDGYMTCSLDMVPVGASITKVELQVRDFDPDNGVVGYLGTWEWQKVNAFFTALDIKESTGADGSMQVVTLSAASGAIVAGSSATPMLQVGSSSTRLLMGYRVSWELNTVTATRARGQAAAQRRQAVAGALVAR